MKQNAKGAGELDCLRDCNGACCQGFLVYETDRAGAELLDPRRMRAEEQKDGKFHIYTPPCRFLDLYGRCSIQSMKPEPCKKLPVGGAACLNARREWCPPQK